MIHSHGVVALVPMKGHSERVPNKNLLPIAGRPLCDWVIRTLKACPEVSEIVVNTDSDAIAAHVREEHGATVHMRPEELCGDFVSMNRIIEYDLQRLGSPGRVIQTHSTNPLLTSATITESCERVFGDTAHDSGFTVTQLQGRFFDANGAPINHNPDELLRTQDLPPLYLENSNLYVFSSASFARHQRRIGTTPLMISMSAEEAVDIDTWFEWHVAASLLNLRQGTA
jgi:N-acylneuraminate cytidylyltransferase